MTYGEMIKIEKDIIALKALIKVSEENEEAEIGLDVQKQIEKLKNTYAAAINRLPVKTIEGGCLYLRLCKKKSWASIAIAVGGSYECVKKMCYRFKW